MLQLEGPCNLCGKSFACSCPLLLRADAAYRAGSNQVVSVLYKGNVDTELSLFFFFEAIFSV